MYWLNALVKFNWLIIPGLFILVFYLSIYIVLFSIFFSLISKKTPNLVFLFSPIVWTALEYLRGLGPFGFPWASLGYSLYRNITLIQVASFTSVYGISWFIVSVNSVIAFVLVSKKKERFLYLLAIGLVGICLHFYGRKVLNQSEGVYINRKAQSLKVAIIQGNIEQEVKWDPLKEEENLEIHFQLTEQAGQQHTPDLIIWPETAITYPFSDHPEIVNRLLSIAKKYNVYLLVGVPDYVSENEEIKLYNSAFLISPAGKVLDRYDKIQLVPYGEYTPLSKYFPFLGKLVGGPMDYSAGKRYTVFEMVSKNEKAKFSVLICFESILSHLARRFVKNGADFLIIITNDAWYGRTAAPYQHAYMAVFRAIENGVYIFRAANTGYSCIIDPYGRIISSLDIFQRGILVKPISLFKKKTFYSLYGDFFAWSCLILVFVIFVGSFVWHRRSI